MNTLQLLNHDVWTQILEYVDEIDSHVTLVKVLASDRRLFEVYESVVNAPATVTVEHPSLSTAFFEMLETLRAVYIHWHYQSPGLGVLLGQLAIHYPSVRSVTAVSAKVNYPCQLVNTLTSVSIKYTQNGVVDVPKTVRHLEVTSLCQNLVWKSNYPRVQSLVINNRGAAMIGLRESSFPMVKKIDFTGVTMFTLEGVLSSCPTITSVRTDLWLESVPNHISSVEYAIRGSVPARLSGNIPLTTVSIACDAEELATMALEMAMGMDDVVLDLRDLPVVMLSPCLLAPTVSKLKVWGDSVRRIPDTVKEVIWDSPSDFHGRFHSNLVTLELSRIRVRWTFKDWHHLRRLVLTKSNSKEIVIEAPNVEHVDISRNNLWRFSVPSSTKHLDVSFNVLTKLPDISHLEKLEKLNLKRNHLREVPHLKNPQLYEINIDDNLQEMTASSNAVRTIHSWFIVNKSAKQEPIPETSSMVGNSVHPRHYLPAGFEMPKDVMWTITPTRAISLSPEIRATTFISPSSGQFDNSNVEWLHLETDQSQDLSQTSLKYLSVNIGGQPETNIIIPTTLLAMDVTASNSIQIHCKGISSLKELAISCEKYKLSIPGVKITIVR